ncbi:lactoylglutathione lyase [Paraburkholderia sediminicola]|uniref:lactoylglutathione lyase n=1 Tax=Paraburkholderia sediminicola TaxID=458836 RepID=UPI0038B9AE94
MSIVLNHTMLRVRDPQISLRFYQENFGMKLVNKFDFPQGKFSLYFLAPSDSEESSGSVDWIPKQKGLLELTHNWGTEADADFAGYHNGNTEPRGFGHICFSVPNVNTFCDELVEKDVTFVKRPNDGSMKGIAFVADPDGYWIEIIDQQSFASVVS